MTSLIEVRPYEGFSAIDSELNRCVLMIDGENESKERRIEMTRSKLQSPGILRVNITEQLLEHARNIDRSLEHIAIQAFALTKTTRRMAMLIQPTPLSVAQSSVDILIPGDPNGIDLIVEITLLQQIGSGAIALHPPRHAWAARCITTLVSEREPNTFPRKALTSEARDYLVKSGKGVMPGTMYYVEFKRELLGSGFAESLTIWIDEDLGPLLDQKESTEAALVVDKTIAIDVAISVANEAWIEASGKESDENLARLRFTEELECTQWLAHMHREAFGGKSAKGAEMARRAAEFAQQSAEHPELIRAKLQHAWKALTTTKRLLVEAHK
jgi:hypothetical protein